MKRIFWVMMIAITQAGFSSCKKDGTGADNFDNIQTPRTSPVPDELVGRWAIIGISGSTVYNVPAGTTYNTNEMFLGYQINKDGTTREDGYLATYMYGVSTWAKWSAVGSVKLDGNSISFHRARGSYTSSRNSSATQYGSDEVYPNKTSSYSSYHIGTDSRGRVALIVEDEDGETTTYVKQ